MDIIELLKVIFLGILAKNMSKHLAGQWLLNSYNIFAI